MGYRHTGYTLLLITFLTLIKTAWISDDSAITLRTAENFINGNGAVFNLGERVQAYTHPLWFLLISGTSALTKNVLVTAYVLPILVSTISAWLFLSRIGRFTPAALILGAALLFSQAYLDYSTSGLENPLSHILILALLITSAKRFPGQNHNILYASLTTSLIYLTRPDLVIAVLPYLIITVKKENKSTISTTLALLKGGLPVIIWTAASIYYYGFPFPNTAYAKLGNGIPLIDRLNQGVIYFIDSAGRDPITIGIIATAIHASFRGTNIERSLALGIILYLVFIISIGGDFMTGRFFSSPLLISAILLTRLPVRTEKIIHLACITCALGAMGMESRMSRNPEDNLRQIIKTGIADEREFYFTKTGLVNVGRQFFDIPHHTNNSRTIEVTCGGLGFSGLRGGPDLHLIDICGLTDPLLSRLPAKHDNLWRIGHFSRQIPENYEASVEKNRNLLTDKPTRSLYETLRIVTQEPLNSITRLRAIITLNLTPLSSDLNRYRTEAVPQNSTIPAIRAEALQSKRDINTDITNTEGYGFAKEIDIVLNSSTFIQGVDVQLVGTGPYLLSMYFNGKFIPLGQLSRKQDASTGPVTYYFLAEFAPKIPTDRLRLTSFNAENRTQIKEITVREPPKQ